MKNKTVITSLILLVVMVGAVKLNTNKTETSVEILVDDSSFIPSDIVVSVGTTVTFKNTGTKEHWPASDPHPTHTAYSEFDPLRSLEPTESWKYTFDKVGNWKFHDHKSPAHRGVVNVVPEDYSMASENQHFNPKCIDSSTDFNCFEEYYNKLVAENGVTAGFTDLKKRYSENAYVRSQCHPLTHVLGHAAVELYPKVFEAYTHGDSFCWSGYYHGVMEGIVENIGEEKVLSQLNIICADIPGKAVYNFDYYNCVHGLGHGLMAISENELMGTLETCETLVGGWEKSSCYGGAFMENVIVDNKGHFTKYLKPTDPLYPCNAVASQYKDSCYLMQTSYMLKIVNNDFGQVFNLCRGADRGYENLCFQSLGRDASGQSLSNADRTKAVCDLGKDYNEKSNCIIGAVKDFISYYHSDVEAKHLCSILSLDLQKTCLDTTTSYYSSF